MARVALGSSVVLFLLLIAGALPAFSSSTSAGHGEFTVTRLVGPAQPAAPGRPAAPRVLPLRVANPVAYHRQKASAEHRYQLWSRDHGLESANPAIAPLTSVVSGLDDPGISDPADGTPSDSTGAIGPSNYVEFINSEIAVYPSTDLSAPTDTLDESTFVGDASKFTCDVQIQWDEQGQRWLYAALDCGETEGSGLEAFYFGWSKTASPDLAASNWCRYKISTGASLEDYPKLGHDDSQIIIGTNAFADDGFGNYTASHIFVFDKPADGVSTCPTGSAEGSTAIEAVTDVADFTPVPANIADDSTVGYVAAARSYSDQSHIDLYTIGRNASGANAVLGTMTVTVPFFAFPAAVPQESTSDTLDSLDTRLTQAVAITDPATGKEGIWTQHTVDGGGPSVVRWYELEPGRTTPERTGTVSGPSGSFAFNAAISPTGTGSSAVLTYNSGSASRFSDWRAQDPTASTTSDIQLAVSSNSEEDFSCTSPYGPPCRWGDYAGASPDPVNPCVAWGTSMLTVASPDFVNGTPQWGTQNAAIATSSGTCSVTALVTKAGSGSGTVTSSPAGVDCGSTCSHAYAAGTSVTLTAAPATGSSFTGWSGACSGTGTCQLTMNQVKAVTATFTLVPETLSVTRSGSGSGSVSSSPAGVSCGSTCSHAYDYGTSVTLTASPATGSSFAGWSGACSGTGPCTVGMTQAQSVTASFSLIPETVTVSRSGSGSGTVSSSPAGISCGSACSHAFSYGTSVTLTAAPAFGSSFTGWSGACSGTSACTVSMTAARAVTATFQGSQTLTVTKSGRGTVSSSPAGISCGATCSHAYLYGTTLTLTAKPASGSVFKGWSGVCAGKGTCTVTMTGARSAQAAFARKVICTVPKVKGKTLRKAKGALRKHHCRPGKITKKFSSVKKGHVISQKPRPHKHLRKGAKVKLVVSKGKKP